MEEEKVDLLAGVSFKKRKRRRATRERTSSSQDVSPPKEAPKTKKSRSRAEDEEENDSDDDQSMCPKIGDPIVTNGMNSQKFNDKTGVVIHVEEADFGAVAEDRLVIKFDEEDLGTKAIKIINLVKQEDVASTSGYKSSRNIVPAQELNVTVDTTVFAKEKPKKDQNEQIEAEDGTYKGLKNYKKYLKPRSTPGKFNRPGPVPASEHIRVTSRFDYQPDICKDYKETGYCGYGDSCKFLHDRGDYKSGWQIEREWEEAQKKKSLGIDTDDDAGKYYVGSDDEEDLPFACHICREEFVNPVKTKCKHFFCEKCAFETDRKTSRCALCNEPTQGIFNAAPDLEKKIALKKKMDGGDTSDVPKSKHRSYESGWAQM